MYLPRHLISHLYLHLLRTHHPLSPPVLLLVALEPDALCACRILTTLLKRDYIPHKIQPIAGYGDLSRAGEELVRPMRLSDGGSGGVAVCLGVGGLVDLEAALGLEVNEAGEGGADGVEVWVFDARRPWNLENVFGGQAAMQTVESELPRKILGVEQGQISREYRPGDGGIIVFDDGDIEQELAAEREAYCALEGMPEIVDDEEEELDESESEANGEGFASPDSSRRKRKSWSDREDEDESGSEKENRPNQRRRSNSSSPIPSYQVNQSRRTPLSPSHHQASFPQSTPPSNQQSSPPRASGPKEASPRTLRRRLLRLRRKHDSTLHAYYTLGTSYSEPISSLMYSLASELGREDNDLLWLAIVGVSSGELYGRTPTGLSLSNPSFYPTTFTGWSGNRGSRIRQTLRDEVRRLNPPELTETGREVARGQATDAIPTHARSPTDTSIRLSPEPRFLLIRHWSLYESMLHSPYLSAKLHIWSEVGRRRLHKLLAKMGVSLTQCKQSYTHMDMDLKKVLRERLLHFAPMYGLEGLVPPPSTGHGGDKEGWGFVRSWGWKACLSAADVAVVIGAMLEIGSISSTSTTLQSSTSTSIPATDDAMPRFYAAYDALLSPTQVSRNITLAQSLHRSIFRTGTSLLQKRHIRHLRAFRLALVKEGPDVALFCHPGALTKLALWVAEAVGEVERENGKFKAGKGGSTPLVVGCLDEGRGVYVIVGTGGGGGQAVVKDALEKKEKEERREKRKAAREEKEAKREAKRREREENGDEEELETEDEGSSSEDDEDSSDDEAENATRRGPMRNRFGNAFQEVVEDTKARVRIDSFDHSVVEVKKEDLSGFLESLSMKAVVG